MQSRMTHSNPVEDDNQFTHTNPLVSRNSSATKVQRMCPCLNKLRTACSYTCNACELTNKILQGKAVRPIRQVASVCLEVNPSTSRETKVCDMFIPNRSELRLRRALPVCMVARKVHERTSSRRQKNHIRKLLPSLSAKAATQPSPSRSIHFRAVHTSNCLGGQEGCPTAKDKTQPRFRV